MIETIEIIRREVRTMSTMKPIQATPTLSGKDAEAVIRQTNTMPTKEAIARNQMLSRVLANIRK